MNESHCCRDGLTIQGQPWTSIRPSIWYKPTVSALTSSSVLAVRAYLCWVRGETLSPPSFLPLRPLFRLTSKNHERQHTAIFTPASNWPVKIVYLCPGRIASQLGQPSQRQGVDRSSDPFPELGPNKARCLKFSRRKAFSIRWKSGWGDRRKPCLCSQEQERLRLVPWCGLSFQRNIDGLWAVQSLFKR